MVPSTLSSSCVLKFLCQQCDGPAGKAGLLQGRPKEILSVSPSIAKVLGLYHLLNFTSECHCDQESGSLGLY